MASVYYLFDDSLNLSDDVVHLYQKHGQKLIKENAAATKIQRVYRGYLARKEIKRWNNMATKIQKVARGWMVRMRYPDFLHKAYDEMCLKRYNLAASKIQAHWKGILVRKEINIKQIMEEKAEAARQSEKLRKLLASGGGEDSESEPENETDEEKRARLLRNKEKLAKKYKPYMEKIGNMLIDRHHLLRTKNVKGVFSKKHKQELSEIEKLLKVIPWTNYMKKVRQIYVNYSEDKDSIFSTDQDKFVDKRLEKERKLLNLRDRSKDVREIYEIYDDKHKKPFKLTKIVDKKPYERLMNSKEKYKVNQMNIVRSMDSSKNLSEHDFDLNVFFKEIAEKCDVKPYYIDYWFKSCTAHNIDDI